MPADVAQELDVVERRQPFGVVDHHGIGLAVAEIQKARKDLLDAVLVGLDLLDRTHLARFVLAGGIADAGGAAAHQCDRLAAAPLQPGQHHDGNERTDMQ